MCGILWEWMQQATRKRHVVACGLPCCIFPHYLKKAQFSKKKMLLNIKYVFWFSLKLLSETFLVLRRIEILSKMYIGLHVKYPLFLSDSTKTWIFLAYFRNIQIWNFMKIRQVGAELCHAERRTGRWTDGETWRSYSRFSQFCERAYKRSKEAGLKISSWVHLAHYCKKCQFLVKLCVF